MGLAVTGLCKGYRDLQVLKDLDLAVADGEIVAIRGQSGTGKSTLLHCLGLLDRADAGTIVLGGDDLANLRTGARAQARSQHIGFVFQAFNLLPEFDALENVLIAARIADLPLAAATADARALLERVGMGSRMRGDVRTLSGGERQRVSLCRALLTKPTLLLADEPTGNLDPVTAKVVLDELVTLARDRKASVVIVTHDPEIAKRADRTLDAIGAALWSLVALTYALELKSPVVRILQVGFIVAPISHLVALAMAVACLITRRCRRGAALATITLPLSIVTIPLSLWSIA